MDILEAARLLRFQTDWERRFHHYNLLLNAGLEPEEAARIADLPSGPNRRHHPRKDGSMTKADLTIIPDVVARWQADTDFRIARECRAQARRLIRDRAPGWRFSHRLELRRALRYWQHYKTTVRAFQ